MLETPILKNIQVALVKFGARVFRNQVGTYQLMDGRWLSSGLCVGSSDLIGWYSVEVTSNMIGKKVAIFMAVEVKRPKKGKRSDLQVNFINTVRDSGGIAFFANSADEATELLRGHHV